MKIAFVGAGSIGGYFGALLAASGADVRFLVRQGRAAGLAAAGIRVEGPAGPLTHLQHPHVVEDPSELRDADLILLSVKTYDLLPVAAGLAPFVGDSAVVATLQNGVDALETISPLIAPRNLIAGAAYVSAYAQTPGLIRLISPMSAINIGSGSGFQRPVMQAFAEAGQRAGIQVTLEDDITAVLWRKFILLCTNAALTSLARQPAGYLYHDADCAGLAEQSIAELLALAHSKNVALPVDIAQTTLAFLRALPAGMYASMANDLMHGRRLELDSLSGYVVREGRRLGLPTPFHAIVYAALKPYLQGQAKTPETTT